MLRRKSAAVTSKRNENATWPTSSALATVTRRRLLPAVRADSFNPSATLARDALKAGMASEQETGGQRHNQREDEHRGIQFRRGEVGGPGQSAEQDLEPA